MVRLLKGHFGSSLARHDLLHIILFLHALSWQITVVAAVANELSIVTSTCDTACPVLDDGSSHCYVCNLNPSLVINCGSMLVQIKINILRTFNCFLNTSYPLHLKKKDTHQKKPKQLFSRSIKSGFSEIQHF